MRDEMSRGDWVLVYHSNAKPPGIAGVAKIAKEAYPDHTAFDAKDPHYDPKSDPENPRWMMVDIKLSKIFEEELSLSTLRDTESLAGMALLQKGSRLSVQPVGSQHFNAILKMARVSKSDLK